MADNESIQSPVLFVHLLYLYHPYYLNLIKQLSKVAVWLVEKLKSKTAKGRNQVYATSLSAPSHILYLICIIILKKMSKWSTRETTGFTLKQTC